MDATDRVIICDNGTGFVKCGFEGDKLPLMFPAMVGRPIVRTKNKKGFLAIFLNNFFTFFYDFFYNFFFNVFNLVIKIFK